MRPAPLSPSLERLVLGGMARGIVPPDIVSEHELGSEGRWIYQAVKRLRKGDKEVPVASLIVTAEELGGDPDALRPYVRKMTKAAAGAEVREILRLVRQRRALVEVVNAATAQLAEGKLDPSAIAGHLRVDDAGDEEDDSLYSDEDVQPPTGPAIVGLPSLHAATGGLFGLWMVAGDTGAGKSTLALQLGAIAAGAHGWHVGYVDFENTRRVLIHRLQKALTSKQYKKAAPRIHYVSVERLASWMQAHEPPAMIVIDPFQKLPSKVDHKRESLDGWLKKFEEWAKAGYMVVALSEKDRSTYGAAKVSGFKETGSAEYTAWVGAQLLAGRHEDDPAEFHIVKNRHRPRKGHITDLVRDEARPFWFKEDDPVERDEEVD